MKLIPKFLNPFSRLPYIKSIIGNKYLKKLVNKIREDKNDPWGIPHNDPETSTRLHYIPEVTIKRSEDPYYKMIHLGNIDEKTKEYIARSYDSDLKKPEMERLYNVYKEAGSPNLHYYKGRGYNDLSYSYKQAHKIWKNIGLSLLPISFPLAIVHILNKDKIKSDIRDHSLSRDIHAGDMEALISELAHPILVKYGTARLSGYMKEKNKLKKDVDYNKNLGDAIVPGRDHDFYYYWDLLEGLTHLGYEPALKDYIKGADAEKGSDNLNDYKQTASLNHYINKVNKPMKYYNESGIGGKNYWDYWKSTPSIIW